MRKNIYSIHDESGRITQSNQVFDDGGYSKVLNQHGQRFHQHGGESHASLTHHWIRDAGKAYPRLANRNAMPISIDKAIIKPDGNDVAKIYGIPKGALVRVVVGGIEIASEVQTGKLPFELVSVTPATYLITVSMFPLRDWSGKVSAIA